MNAARTFALLVLCLLAEPAAVAALALYVLTRPLEAAHD